MRQKSLSLTLPVTLSVLTKSLVFVFLSVVSFAVPFFLGHPQWLVGPIVNTFLFLGVIFLPGRFYLPLIVFPGLAVLSRGIIFGPFTSLLIYFLPFIWLANFILMITFFKIYPRLNYLFSVFLAAAVKFLFLLAIANIYFRFSLIPGIFLQTMGLNQFFTAFGGGIISWIIFESYGKRQPRN